MNISHNFNNRLAVITGAAQGIGFEIARQMVKSEAFVCLWDFSKEGLDRAVSELKSFSSKILAVQVDVSQFESCQKAAKALPRPVDILINNAGIVRDRSFPKMSQEEFQAVIDTNLTGVFNVTQSLLQNFSPTSFKRIVNMASVVALYGNFGQTNYAASKAGVLGMTKTWAKELGRKGFTVNAIAPGFIQTEMLRKIPEAVLSEVINKTPVQRLGTPADIASACLFLCSEEAGFINGEILQVDGGLVI